IPPAVRSANAFPCRRLHPAATTAHTPATTATCIANVSLCRALQITLGLGRCCGRGTTCWAADVRPGLRLHHGAGELPSADRPDPPAGRRPCADRTAGRQHAAVRELLP